MSTSKDNPTGAYSPTDPQAAGSRTPAPQAAGSPATRSARLDVALVERGLAPSRAKAQQLIAEACVSINGRGTTKASAKVGPEDLLTVADDAAATRYVSRGGLKLEHAIHAFDLDLRGLRVLDIGSSTGGFTDCALQHGAAHVHAVDVGTGCMVPHLAAHPQVSLHEQTDIRDAPESCFLDIDLVVCDASFVPLQLVLEPLHRVRRSDGCTRPLQVVALIKPQFQVGAALARKHRGVITDARIHAQVVDQVLADLAVLGLHALSVVPSPIKGGDGNTEFLALLEQRR